MNKTFCGKCYQDKNTFLVDQSRYFKIRLCLKCAFENGFKIDLSQTIKCSQCGERFQYICSACKMPRKSRTCLVCWKSFFAKKKPIVEVILPPIKTPVEIGGQKCL